MLIALPEYLLSRITEQTFLSFVSYTLDVGEVRDLSNLHAEEFYFNE